MNRSIKPANQLTDFIAWFNSFYTKDKRTGLHLLMWFIFAVLLEMGLLLTYRLSFYTSTFYIGTSLIGNSLIFYLFFYFIYPHFFLKKKVFAAIISIIALLLLWRLDAYLSNVLTYHYAHVENLNRRKIIEEAMNEGFLSVFSPRRIVGGFIDILYSISPVFCLKISVDRLKSVHHIAETEKEKAALEIAFLKSQLNPHFLFNTLNSIYILNMKGDEPAAGEIILDLSDTLRYTLYESNTEQADLEKELIFIENYVSLERVRQSRHTRIVFDCDPSVAAGMTIAPLLTFPFIENAFKHGLGTSLKDAWLEIEINMINHVFHFHIRNSKNDENNGKQIREYMGGIGVGNTKKRLELLYPGKHLLEIMNTPDEYSVDLKINLNHE